MTWVRFLCNDQLLLVEMTLGALAHHSDTFYLIFIFLYIDIFSLYNCCFLCALFLYFCCNFSGGERRRQSLRGNQSKVNLFRFMLSFV